MDENIDDVMSEDEEINGERISDQVDKEVVDNDNKAEGEADDEDEEEEAVEERGEDDDDIENMEEEEESPEGEDNNIEEQYGEYFDHAELPDELKGLKACLSCSLVKTYAQFYDQGCDNCEYLRMKDDARKVKSSTTSYFEGLIALIEPQSSWVAKWQRIVQMKPGMYAIEVSGKLLDEEDVNEDDDLIDDI